MLDSDLARLYGVPTKAFNQAIKRNAARFPADFAFQLTSTEANSLSSQNVTINDQATRPGNLKSQIVTSRLSHGGRRYLPWVFTEHGAVMAANVLRSPKAIEMSVYVVRAFVLQREAIAANQTILKRLADGARSAEMAWLSGALQPDCEAGGCYVPGADGRDIAQIDKTLLEHDAALRTLWHRLQPLLQPAPEPPAKELGYHTTMKKP